MLTSQPSRPYITKYPSNNSSNYDTTKRAKKHNSEAAPWIKKARYLVFTKTISFGYTFKYCDWRVRCKRNMLRKVVGGKGTW